MKIQEFDPKICIRKQSEEFTLQLFIPEYIRNVVIINLTDSTKVKFSYGNFLFKKSLEIEVKREGIHFCLCNLTRPKFKLWLEFTNKIFLVKKVKRSDVLVLAETGWTPLEICRPLPLGDTCALELLFQGTVSCELDLAFPLIEVNTVIVNAGLWLNFMEGWRVIPTCKVSHKIFNYHSLALLAINILER